ncbi:MAG TPA: hypothetical protein VLY03_02910 [Bacteroidota bacterium]|nr:hypothetical protein [Bacteroidota bacterium]
MRSLFSKSVVVLLIAVQLCSLVVVDEHHLEDVFGPPNAQHSLTTPAAGTNKTQEDIPDFCLACLRQANVGLVIASPTLPGVVQDVSLPLVHLATPFRPSDFYTYASKRGPPLFLS